MDLERITIIAEANKLPAIVEEVKNLPTIEFTGIGSLCLDYSSNSTVQLGEGTFQRVFVSLGKGNPTTKYDPIKLSSEFKDIKIYQNPSDEIVASFRTDKYFYMIKTLK